MKGERRSERTRCSISTWYELGKDRVDQVGRITSAVEVRGQPTEADLWGEPVHPGEPGSGDLEATLGTLVDRNGRLGGPFGKLRGDAPFAQLGGDDPGVGRAARAAPRGGVRRQGGPRSAGRGRGRCPAGRPRAVPAAVPAPAGSAPAPP